jgi:hypothetical protein
VVSEVVFQLSVGCFSHHRRRRRRQKFVFSVAAVHGFLSFPLKTRHTRQLDNLFYFIFLLFFFLWDVGRRFAFSLSPELCSMLCHKPSTLYRFQRCE